MKRAIHPHTRDFGVGVHRRSCLRKGRVVPAAARGLRAAVVVLPPGGVMDWHSTHAREELLVALAGRVRVEVRSAHRLRRLTLKAGTCAFLPRHTLHRVVNQSSLMARYLYVTAPTR